MHQQFELHLSDEEEQRIEKAFKELIEVLAPKLIQLPQNAKRKLPSLGDKNKGFVDVAHQVAEQEKQLLKAYVNNEQFNHQMEVLKKLNAYQNQVRTLHSLLDDSMALTDSQVYSKSLDVYRLMKIAHKSKHIGANPLTDELAKAFPGRKK